MTHFDVVHTFTLYKGDNKTFYRKIKFHFNVECGRYCQVYDNNTMSCESNKKGCLSFFRQKIRIQEIGYISCRYSLSTSHTIVNIFCVKHNCVEYL